MSAIAIDDPRLVFVPFEKATTPITGHIWCYVDYWWVTHPERGVLFYQTGRVYAPQCNANRDCAESVRSSIYPWAEVVQIPAVFWQRRD